MRLMTLALVTMALALAASDLVRAQEDLLAALRMPGHIGLMRHSTAPGSDDPPDFKLGDCSTQRNLSAGARRWILSQALSTPTILVTHQINIGAIVNAYPNEGDIVVVQRTAAGELRVLGTIAAAR